jgi:hypothetical protein
MMPIQHTHLEPLERMKLKSSYARCLAIYTHIAANKNIKRTVLFIGKHRTLSIGAIAQRGLSSAHTLFVT